MSFGFRVTASSGLARFEQALEFLHDLRVLEIEIRRPARISGEVVKLAGTIRRGVGPSVAFEFCIVVFVPAGAGVVDVFPSAATDGKCASATKGLRQQIRAVTLPSSTGSRLKLSSAASGGSSAPVIAATVAITSMRLAS